MELISWILLALVALYVAFAFTMRFKMRRERRGYLHTHEKLIAYPIVAVGYPLDVVVNATIATALFLDLPREWTLSDRLERYIVDGAYAGDWRETVALWIDRKFIEPHDEDHLG